MQVQRTIQPEAKNSFRGNVDFLALGDDLRSGSGARARDCADCRAFSSARNRADDRSKHGSPAHILTCALVRPDAISAIFQLLIFGADAIAPSGDGNGFDVERDVTAVPLQPPRDQTSFGTTGNCN